jgi:hypothetical protein
MVDNLPRHASLLACAGLTPYIAAAAALLLLPGQQVFISRLIADYSFGIIAFLLGAWWGLALIRRCPGALWLSNVVFIVAFFGKALLSTSAWLMLAAILMIAIWLVEGRHSLFRPQPGYYRSLRGLLSGVSAVCLVASAYLLSAG